MALPFDEVVQSTKSPPSEATDAAKPALPVFTPLAKPSGLSSTLVVQLVKTSAPAVQPTNPPA